MAEILTLQYPKDINSQKDNDIYANRRVIFMAMPGEPDSVKQDEFYKTNKYTDLKDLNIEQDIKAIISLPIPSSLSDAQSHEWSEETYASMIGDIGGDVVDLAKNHIKGSWEAGNKFESITEDLTKLGKIAVKGNSLIAHGVGVRKSMMKAGFFQNYKSSDLRSFSFSFKFIPETKEEGDEIRKIIGAFKALSSPSSVGENNVDNSEANRSWMESFRNFFTNNDIASGMLMMSPFVWQIVVTNPKVNSMLQLKTCVCTNVTVTYGNEKFDCFSDGMPKTITMQLNFKEVQLQYAENYAKSIGILTNQFNMNPATLGSVGSNIKEGAKSVVENITNDELRTKTGTEIAKSIGKNGLTLENTSAMVVQGITEGASWAKNKISGLFK
jgi:hypothetical protein